MSSIPWYTDFIGIAYRYFDLRMNIIPLFTSQTQSLPLWQDVIHWWVNPSIKVRFVETGDDYWFILGADSQIPDRNLAFYKVLPKSVHYERFKKGHGGEAYLRFGVYSKIHLVDAKKGMLCECGHEAVDHDEGDGDVCLYNTCDCKRFETFQVNMLKRKKTITNIMFLDEEQVKDDALAWNCLYRHKYLNRS